MKKLFGLILAALLFASPSSANSLLLDSTSKALEMETSSAASVDWIVSWADHTTTAFTPGMSQGNVASATTTTIAAAPAASTQRQVKWVSVRNRSTTTANTITLKLDVSSTEYHVGPPVVLGPGESLRMDAEGNLLTFNSSGVIKTANPQQIGNGSRDFVYQKPHTTKDAAGYWYAGGKDSGFPVGYALQSPGLNGFNTDCGTVSNTTNPIGAIQAGANFLPDPTGGWYLTNITLASTALDVIQLVDVLWYNTGLAVTTTTGQTVTMPGAIPARDPNGTTDGVGVFAALLSTALTGNGAAITNTTITYTDSDGNAGNTGTFFAHVGWQAPASAVAGTWMPFQLATGDRGVRSVQTITLGTSYASGSLSLVLYRPIITIPTLVINQGSTVNIPAPGLRIYNDSCLWMTIMGAITANPLAGSYTLNDR